MAVRKMEFHRRSHDRLFAVLPRQQRLLVCHIQAPPERVPRRTAGPHRTPARGRQDIQGDRRCNRKVQEALRQAQKGRQGPPSRCVPLPNLAPLLMSVAGQAESGKSTMLRSMSFPPTLPPRSPLSRLSARLLSDLLPSRNSDMEGHHPAQSHRVSPIARIYSSPHFSTAPSRGCLPSSKTSLRALSLAAPQLPQVAHPPPVTRSRAQAPPLRPATSFPPPSQHHPGRALPISSATPPTPP